MFGPVTGLASAPKRTECAVGNWRCLQLSGWVEAFALWMRLETEICYDFVNILKNPET
jgi:hypothetical protein